MPSHRKGGLSATTQVKVLSPEISIVARGQAFHIAETSNGSRAKGECGYGVPGSKSAAGKSTVMPELGRTVRSRENEYHKGAEKATAWKAEAVVGPVHSRGVAAPQTRRGRHDPLEGAGTRTLRRRQNHAIR